MADLTVGQLLSSVLGSVWAQSGLVAFALASVAYDRRESFAGLRSKLSAWWTARRTGTPAPAVESGCEQRRLTLVGIRHKASEHTDPIKRSAALALCDQVDALVKELWPEAA